MNWLLSGLSLIFSEGNLQSHRIKYFGLLGLDLEAHVPQLLQVHCDSSMEAPLHIVVFLGNLVDAHNCLIEIHLTTFE